MISRPIYAIKQAIKQLWRNKAMGVASIFAISSMLLILGLFFIISININVTAETVKQDYDSIEVFLLDDVGSREREELMDEIQNWKNVSSIEYRSKKEAMDILKKRWAENGYLLDSLQENPLPNSIIIKADSLENAEEIAREAESLDGVEDVKYYQDVVDKLLKATKFLQIAAIVIMGFLVIISVVVVSNTIKLTVFNRSEEIEIMKYVGATNWFIRGPFLVEGIIIGAVSALIASGVVLLLYDRIIALIGQDVLTVLSMSLVPISFLGVNLLWIFLAIGVSIGAWGSIISMRRFLDTQKGDTNDKNDKRNRFNHFAGNDFWRFQRFCHNFDGSKYLDSGLRIKINIPDPTTSTTPPHFPRVRDISVTALDGKTRVYYDYISAESDPTDSTGKKYLLHTNIEYIIAEEPSSAPVSVFKSNGYNSEPYKGYLIPRYKFAAGANLLFVVESVTTETSGGMRENNINIRKFVDKDNANPANGMEEAASAFTEIIGEIGKTENYPSVNDARVWKSDLYILSTTNEDLYPSKPGKSPKIFGKILRFDDTGVNRIFPKGSDTGEKYNPSRFMKVSDDLFMVSSDAFISEPGNEYQQSNKKLVCNADGLVSKNPEEEVKAEFLKRLHTYDGITGFAFDKGDDETAYKPLRRSILWESNKDTSFKFWYGMSSAPSSEGKALDPSTNCKFTDVFCFDADYNLWIVEKDASKKYFAKKFEFKSVTDGFEASASEHIELIAYNSKTITSILDITVEKRPSATRIYFLYNDESDASQHYTNIDYITLSNPSTPVEAFKEEGDKTVTAITTDNYKLILARKVFGRYAIQNYADKSNPADGMEIASTRDIAAKIGTEDTVIVNDIKKWNSILYVLSSKTTGEFGSGSTTPPAISGTIIEIDDSNTISEPFTIPTTNPYRFIGIEEKAMAIAVDGFDTSDKDEPYKQVNKKYIQKKNMMNVVRVSAEFSKTIHKADDPSDPSNPKGYAWDQY